MARSKVNKILTLDDLEKFYSKYKRSTTFSAKKSGYQLAVQVPAYFEEDEKDYSDTLLYCKARFFHTGINRNQSSVTVEAAEKAMTSMAYKPVLANFCEIEDKNGQVIKDFTSHDMQMNEDGEIEYFEHQIGCITADTPWFETDEENGKQYICGYVAIPREYTDAVDIIERKNGTKVSVELLVNELNYDAKEKVMTLTDIIISGVTCLGVDPNSKQEVGEGMEGSRLDIQDFSKTNNSIFSSITQEEKQQLVELRDAVTKLTDRFNINEETQENYGKEDANLEEKIKVNSEEVIEVEDIVETPEIEITEAEETSTEEATDAVTENESEEVDTPEVVDQEEVEVTELNAEEEVEVTENESVDETEACGGGSGSGSGSTKKKKKHSIESEDGTTQTFELSLDEKIYALEALVNAQYSESDNTYYAVKAYDDHIVMIDYWTGRAYKQAYTVDNDAYSLSGDRVEVYATYVTAEEQKALDNMKASYAVISDKLNAYEVAEDLADKKTVFDDEAYANYLDTNEFKALMSEDTMKQFTKDELIEKADCALGKLVKTSKNFALVDSKKQTKVVNFAKSLIENEPTKNSFLDGLLNTK